MFRSRLLTLCAAYSLLAACSAFNAYKIDIQQGNVLTQEMVAQLKPGQTREQVLQGLRTLTAQNWRRMKTELQAHVALRGRASVSLAGFLHDQALELEDVYRASNGSGRSGWTNLKREAGLIVAEPGTEEEYFSRRFAGLLHVDDSCRLDAIGSVARDWVEARQEASKASTTVQMLD
jgi:hypothetical protein